MGTNNDHKVSNLTVGPHRNSSLNILNSITNITEAPPFIQGSRRNSGIPYPFNYTGIFYHEKENHRQKL